MANVFARRGRYAYEVSVRLLEEYGERPLWPAALDLASEVLFVVDRALPPTEFRRVLDAVGTTADPQTLASTQERLATAMLSAAVRELGSFNAIALLSCAMEADDERRRGLDAA